VTHNSRDELAGLFPARESTREALAKLLAAHYPDAGDTPHAWATRLVETICAEFHIGRPRPMPAPGCHAVACPRCGVGPGVECITTKGKPRGGQVGPHPRRWDAWKDEHD
jgi:hypothetical protein